MKNTAKNGLPMRFELRECVLGLALIYGFEKDEILAEMLFSDNIIRKRQVVFLRIPKEHIEKISVSALKFAIEVVKRYYQFIETEDELIFFDTKKFRIYYRRLVWGREKKIILDKTIQYFRSDLVNMMLTEFLVYVCADEHKDNVFENYWWYRNAKDPDASQQKYLSYVFAPKKEKNNITEYSRTVLKKKKIRRVKIG